MKKSLPTTLFILALTITFVLASPGFQSTTYSTGTTPVDVAYGNVDGAGEVDVAVVNLGSQDVSVFLNNNGILSLASTVHVGVSPASLILADLNGDGLDDIAGTNRNLETIFVSLSNGDGTFSTTSFFEVYPQGISIPFPGVKPVTLHAGDLDNDGDLDIATGNSDSIDISILLNDGSGDFTATTLYEVTSKPSTVKLADVNSDGSKDIIAAIAANSYNLQSMPVEIFLNDGQGTFLPPQRYSTGSRPIDMTLTDLDSDGDLDIATVNSNNADRSVSALYNNGAGVFSGGKIIQLLASPQYIESLDHDSDEDQDLVISNFGGDRIEFFTNIDGTFFSEIQVPIGDGPNNLAVTDLDGSGSPDIIVPLSYDHEIVVLLSTISPPTNNPPVANAGGDLNFKVKGKRGSVRVTLDAADSYDPDGDELSFLWEENGNELSTSESFSFPYALGTHVITLTVTDEQGAQDSDTVTVTIRRRGR